MEKLLSIIIPSYNMERLLPKCLSSLIIDDKELLQKLDVIVVNDGSKDRTSEIAHDFEAKYPGVFRVIDKPNGHYGSCINSALPIAIGEYVKVLDADDWFDTAGLVRILRCIQALGEDSDKPELFLTDYDQVDENGIATKNVRYSMLGSGVVAFKEAAEVLRKVGSSMHAFAYLRSVFNGLNYHQLEGINYTDTQWVIVPLSRVRNVYYCPFVLYQYLVGRAGQSIDNTIVMKNISQVIAVWRSNLLWYESCGRETPNAMYIKGQIEGYFAWIYHQVLFNVTLTRVRAIFKTFDDDCRRIFADDIFESRFVILKNTLSYSVLRAYRHHPVFGFASLFFVRLYAKTVCRFKALVS